MLRTEEVTRAAMLPEIHQRYAGYSPPFDVAKVVRELIDVAPEKYLHGLKTILLLDTASLSRRERLGKVWSRKRKRAKSDILGRYHHNNGAAWIEIRVDTTLESWKGSPGGWFWFPPMRYLCIGNVLYHELGHHIHRTMRPEFRDREDVADDWGVRLSVRFIRKKYWYLAPILTAAARIYGHLKSRGQKLKASSSRK